MMSGVFTFSCIHQYAVLVWLIGYEFSGQCVQQDG